MPSHAPPSTLCRFVLGGVLLAACGAEAEPETDEQPADILLVVFDDWALSDLDAARRDANPWNDLPAVDALAERGQSWRNFYTQPACNPTRVTLTFGVYEGAKTGKGLCFSPRRRRPTADQLTLAGMLQRRGYSTAAFGKWHVGPHPEPGARWEDAPRAHGFDTWRAWNASNLGGHCGSVSYWNWHRVDDGVGARTGEYHSQAVFDAALSWWLTTDGPKFAYVNFQAPHQPFHAPPAGLLPEGHPTPERAREMYEAMVVSVDTLLGRLLGVVDLDRTFVLLLGDNGTPPEAVRDDQEPQRVKLSTFQDGVNVPLLVSGPGVARGTTEALGHAVDLMATLAELSGASVPADAARDSVSLAAVFRDARARPREYVVCEYLEQDGGPLEMRDLAVVKQTSDGLYKGRWHTRRADGFEQRSFFDLVRDASERAPLDPGDALVADLVEDLEEARAAYDRRQGR